MREIPVSLLTDKIEQLFLTANYEIGADIENAVCQALKTEESEIGRSVLGQILEKEPAWILEQSKDTTKRY